MQSSNELDATMTIDPFSPLKQQNKEQQQQQQSKRSSNEFNGLSDSQFMDVDDDDYNNLLNNFEESQEFKKFNSIFSNETDFQQFLDILEKKETDSKKPANFYELARNSLYLQFDPIVQKLSNTLSPDKIKRISLIRDKQEVIKNFLSEIQEEEGSFLNNSLNENNNNNKSPVKQQINNSKQATPKSLPQVQQPVISNHYQNNLKTPTEEALAFIEKAKIQIIKQNSLINESNGYDTPITTISPQTKQQQQQKSNQTTNNNKNDKIQNLLSELSLDEHYDDLNDDVNSTSNNSNNNNNNVNKTVNKDDDIINDNSNDNIQKSTEKSQQQQQQQQTSNINNQTFNNESDNSAQLIDIDKYRIEFTNPDDDSNLDILNISSKQNNRHSTDIVTAKQKLNKIKNESIDNHKFDIPSNMTNGKVNGDNTHSSDYIDEINFLRENERRHIEKIRFLEDENGKFKTIAIEFERIFNNLIKDKEESEIKLKQELLDLTKERDQLNEDILSVEKAFDDLHRRFEKLKMKVEEFKNNEDQLKKANDLLKQQIEKERQKYATLKNHAEEKIEIANVEIDKLRKATNAEIQTLKAELRRSEIRIQSLEHAAKQKDDENSQLTNLLEDLLQKVKPN